MHTPSTICRHILNHLKISSNHHAALSLNTSPMYSVKIKKFTYIITATN